jgi:hypothetical protein
MELSTKEEWVEKEVDRIASRMSYFDFHNRSVARSVVGRDFDFWEREAVREDNHNNRG